ncbi:MAG: signal peptidase I [Planctomycetota bacterium]|jgi:signal peptidase I
MAARSTSRLLVCLRVTACLLVLAALARVTVFTTYKVSGASMRETLQDGDRILVGRHEWIVQPLDAGDTVVLSVDGETLVKRVAACPGDRIAMRGGRVVRNGAEVLETIPAALQVFDSFPEYRLRSNEYFVLGDNRRVSIDSREFGPVSAAQMLGRVVWRVNGMALSPVAALERRSR